VLDSRRQRDEETEVGDIFEGNGESDSSIGSVSNSRFIIFKNLIEKRSIFFFCLLEVHGFLKRKLNRIFYNSTFTEVEWLQPLRKRCTVLCTAHKVDTVDIGSAAYPDPHFGK
jgi:hypothetical protein